MLTLEKQLEGKDILSLRIGRKIGIVSTPIINPNNLKLEGWHVFDISRNQDAVLLSQDVRDILPRGFIVNDHDALTDHEELIRLKKMIEESFSLGDKRVVSNRGKKLGKVSDFAFDKNAMFIQKIYVSQPLIKSLSGGTLIIDRSQIIEITDKKITVREPTVEEREPVPATA